MRCLRICTALFLTALVAVLALGPAAGAVDGDPGVRTLPVANEVLDAPPSAVRVYPADGAGAGSARVLDDTGAEVAAGDLVPFTDGGLGLALTSALEPGVYLVGWSAGASSGSFGFDVEDGPNSPATIAQRAPAPQLKDSNDALVEWLPLVAMLIFVGALSLRFLCTAPAARGAGICGVGIDLRLTRLAAVAIVLYLPAAYLAAAYDKGHVDWGSVWDSFGADAAGRVLAARFVLAALGAALVLPLALRRGAPLVRLLGLALACGLAELVLRKVPTRTPPVLSRAIFDNVMWTGHLWGSALWIGGLVALLALLIASPVANADRAAFWPTAIRRFSGAAGGSVAAVLLSGLWLSWVHMDGLGQLAGTLYGRTLLVKLAIAGVLLAVGAVNLFVVSPQAEAAEATGNDRRVKELMGRHFRATVAVEVVLGLSVLFVAHFLSGSSRNQELQASAELFRTSALAGEVEVGLTPSGLQPGIVDYVVDVAGAAPRRVELRFANTQLNLPAQVVTAAAVGGGRYRASGIYAPVPGPWDVQVRLDGGPAATFALTVSPDPAPLPRAKPKTVTATTWFFGILETVLVALVLTVSFRASRRLRERRLAGPPSARPERVLIEA
jgi:putative copper export protein